ncbi:hypothetical protein U1Q18_045293 [Sarracenia purpurea var. burkii]
MSCLEIEHGNINASELNSLMKSADSVICTNGFNEGEENYELNNCFDRDFLNISPVNVEISVEPEMYFHEGEENDLAAYDDENPNDQANDLVLFDSCYQIKNYLVKLLFQYITIHFAV